MSRKRVDTKSETIVAKWDERFRRNRAQTERALRAAAGREKLPSLRDADFDEDTEQRLRRLEERRHQSAPAPAKAVTWILDALTDWRKVAGLALILAALVAIALKGPEVIRLWTAGP